MLDLCDAVPVPLVWVTGSPGAGKSAVCTVLKSLGQTAFDADWDGYNRWVNRADGNIVAGPPDPVPAGWLARFAWMISRPEVEALAARTHGETAFLCGSVENDAEVWDLFDLVICLVVDSETLRTRLQTRTTNAFGRQPEQMEAALRWNDGAGSAYRGFGATIIDASQPVADVVVAVLAAASQLTRQGTRDGQ
jgi:hypothetical protein